MTHSQHTITGCHFVGEFLDEEECPANVDRENVHLRPKLVADYVDSWSSDDVLKEFTILLKDGRVAVVQGSGLKHEPHPLAGQDVFSVVVRNRTEEALVALFKSADISGIFHGNLRTVTAKSETEVPFTVSKSLFAVSDPPPEKASGPQRALDSRTE